MIEYENTPEMRLRFIRIRESLGLSQRQMSRKMGFHTRFTGSLKRAKANSTNICLFAFASIFGVRAKYLSEGELPIFDKENIDAKAIFDIYCRLSPPYQKCLLEFSYFLDAKESSEGKTTSDMS